MAIKGLTDINEGRFSRLGKLRKGGERVNGQYGPDLDHFRFTSEDPKLVELFTEIFGTTPRVIGVYLPYATPEKAFPSWAEIWNASGLVHRCDGETMSIWLENGKYIRGSKPCPGGHEKGDYKNDAVGRLDVLIPEIIQAGYVGYITMETHGLNDLLAITNMLYAVYNARRDNPLGLQGIKFNLRRVKENISVPGWGDRKGQRARADKWLVKLEPEQEWMQLQLQMQHQAAYGLPSPEQAPQLPAGAIEGDVKEGDGTDGSNPFEDSIPSFNAPEPPPAAPAPAAWVVTNPEDLKTVEQAGEVTTKNGTMLVNCTPDQLKAITVNKLATPVQKRAAEMLLAHYKQQAGS